MRGQNNDGKSSDLFVEGTLGGFFEITCIFLCALGVSIGFTATLSCVSYLTAIFDDNDIFLYLCCCVYGPTLPIVLLQLNCDDYFDRIWGSTRTYSFRVTLTFILGIGCTLYLPNSSGINPEFKGQRSYFDLLIPVVLMGIQSSILYGTFFQLVSLMQWSKKGSGAAAFTFGYQGSSFVSLAITCACGGIGTDSSKMQIDIFFILVAAFQLLALGAFTWMACKSVAYTQAVRRRDEEMKWLAFKVLSERIKNSGADSVKQFFIKGRRLLSSPLLRDYKQQYGSSTVTIKNSDNRDSSSSERKPNVISSFYNSGAKVDKLITGIQRESVEEAQIFSVLLEIVESMEPASNTFVLQKTWPCSLGLFLVIFGSIFLMPFYPYIPGGSSLPQILFYTKLFSDTLSRPLTMLMPLPRSRYLFLLLTFLRLSIFLPIFFLYIYDLMAVQNDLFIIAMVSIYSMTSGLFGTVGYQLAPSILESANGKITAAKQMNLSFNGGCVMALVISFTIIKTVNLGR